MLCITEKASFHFLHTCQHFDHQDPDNWTETALGLSALTLVLSSLNFLKVSALFSAVAACSAAMAAGSFMWSSEPSALR